MIYLSDELKPPTSIYPPKKYEILQVFVFSSSSKVVGDILTTRTTTKAGCCAGCYGRVT